MTQTSQDLLVILVALKMELTLHAQRGRAVEPKTVGLWLGDVQQAIERLGE